MSVEKDRLMKRRVKLRKRHRRWIEKRDTLLLRWALEGKHIDDDQRSKLYAWEIASLARQLVGVEAALRMENIK